MSNPLIYIFKNIRLNTYLLIAILKYIGKIDKNIDIDSIYAKCYKLAFDERKEI